MPPKYDCSPGNFLDLLGEEAAEIVQERFKMIRFSHYPEGRAPGYTGPPARDEFHKEIGDFLAVLEHAIDNGDVDPALITECVQRKHMKLFEEIKEKT